jgi:opacity protein-like surface antigen
LNVRITLPGLVGLLMAAMRSEPACAQVSSGSQELQAYVGEIFGDRITGTTLSSSPPRFDDSFNFGARYTYYFTSRGGVQLSVGHSPGRASDLPGGPDDLDLTTVDLDALWNITPGFDLAAHPFMAYTVVGIGYAWADLDRPTVTLSTTAPITVTGSNGYTANIGLGAKYYLRSNVFIDFDTRYRYLSRVVSAPGQGLNSAETSLNLGYRF